MNVPSLTETSLPKIIQAIVELAKGGSNAVGVTSIAVVTGATETVVEDALCAERSLPVLVPINAAAAPMKWFVKAVRPGAFTIGHDAAPAGALFRYELRRN